MVASSRVETPNLAIRCERSDGSLATCFLTSNLDHHTLSCFLACRQGIDHYCYEAREGNYIRDWCDHFADQDIFLPWVPGWHGPGNDLFRVESNSDKNWVEFFEKLETACGRPVKDWLESEWTLNLWGNGILRA